MTTTVEKAKVSLPNDTSVKVTRSFNAPKKLVYRAHTEPKLVQRWMLGYPGWTMPVCEMDVRVGGKYRWRWKNHDDGKEFGFYGEYKKVQPEKHLAHTEFFDPGNFGGDMGKGANITLDFAEKDGVTTIISVMDFGTKEARDAAMSTGMTDGMEVSYQLLDKLLSEVK